MRKSLEYVILFMLIFSLFIPTSIGYNFKSANNKTEYCNQNDPSSFMDFGPEETGS